MSATHSLCAFAMAVALAFLAPPVSAQADAQHPIVIKDVAGRTVELAAPATRAVVLFNYEEFAAIVGPGAFNRIVGFDRLVWHDWRRSIWNKYVKAVPHIAEIPDVGDSYSGTFSVEKVLALKPQIVIAPKWAFDALGSQVSQLKAAGIPTLVIDYNSMTVADHVASTLAIGEAMGTNSRAEELASLYRSKVADIQARIAAAHRPRPKVYVELGKGPAEYGSSFGADQWGPLIEASGGDNIAKGKIQSEAPLSAEYVLASNPDFIFIAGSNWTNAPHAVEMGFGVDENLTDSRLRAYEDRSGWKNLAAIKNGNLYAIHHGIARTLFDYVGMQFIAKAMYPEQFKDIDPEASLRDYFAKYLPVKYEGTWLHKAEK